MNDFQRDLFIGFVVASCVSAIANWISIPWYAQAAIAVLLTMHFILRK